MPGAVIKKGAKVRYSIIAENAVIEENAVVGADPAVVGAENWGITVIGDNLAVGKNAVVNPDKMITENVKEGEKIGEHQQLLDLFSPILTTICLKS